MPGSGNNSGVDLFIRTRAAGGWTVVAADGAVDVHTAEQLVDALEKAAAARPWLVLDCERLDVDDPSFLGPLVDVYKHAQAAGGSLVLAAAPPRVRQLLRRTGLDQAITVYPNVAGVVG